MQNSLSTVLLKRSQIPLACELLASVRVCSMSSTTRKDRPRLCSMRVTGAQMAGDSPTIRRMHAPVAVVIPTRDRPAQLGRAVASALRQTVAPAEVVVVDDGSVPPVTRRSEWPESVRLIRTEGIGPAAARNAGIDCSRAPLLAFLDDDDRWLPRAVEQRLARIGANVGAVYCGYDSFDRAGRLAVRHLPRPGGPTLGALLCEPEVQTSTLLVTRHAVDAAGRFVSQRGRLDDWLLSIELLRRTTVVGVREVLVQRALSDRMDEHTHLEYRRLLFATTAELRASLPEREWRAVAAHHHRALAIHWTRVGDRARARRELMAAARLQLGPRDAVHLARVLAGGRLWSLLRSGVNRLRWREAEQAEHVWRDVE